MKKHASFTRKALSVLLSLCMILSISGAVLADDEAVVTDAAVDTAADVADVDTDADVPADETAEADADTAADEADAELAAEPVDEPDGDVPADETAEADADTAADEADAEIAAEPVDEPAGDGDAKYYARFGANGDGRSEENPAGSLGDVVSSINADGYMAGDEVTVYLMKSGKEPADNKWDSNDDSVFLALNDVVPHRATITYTSYDPDNPTYITNNNVYSTQMTNHTTIYGPTVFDNVQIIDNRGDYTSDFLAQEFPLTFLNTVMLGSRKGSNGGAFANWGGFVFAGTNRDGKKGSGGGDCYLYIDEASLTGFREVGFVGYADSAAQYGAKMHGDIYIHLEKGTLELLRLDTASASGLSTDFGGHTASLVLDGTTITKFDNAQSGITPKNLGAFQVVKNASATIDYSKLKLACDVYDLTPDEGITLDIEDTGVFTITEKANTYAYAYDNLNPNTIYYGTDSITIDVPGEYLVHGIDNLEDIDLPGGPRPGFKLDKWVDDGKGKLTATFVEDGTATEKDTFYVQYGGKGTGLTPESPLGCVTDAIAAINRNGYTTGDVVTIRVMESADWDFGKGTAQVGKNTGAPNHMTAWNENGDVTVKHDATIRIISEDPENPAHLAYMNTFGSNNSRLWVGGPTIFDDIILVDMRCGYREIDVDGNDVTFGDGVRMAAFPIDYYASSKQTWQGNLNVSEGAGTASLGNIAIGRAYTTSTGGGTVLFQLPWRARNDRGVFLPGYNVGAHFTEDVTLWFDNPSLDLDLHLGCTSDAAQETIFDKNLSIVLEHFSDVTFRSRKYNDVSKNYGPLTVYGGFQVFQMLSRGGSAAFALPKNITAIGGYWDIRVDSNDVFFDLTDTAGVYKIEEGLIALATNGDTGLSIASKDGVLTIPAGFWTITSLPAQELAGKEVKVTFDGEEGDATYVKGYTMALPQLDDTLFDAFLGWEYNGETYTDSYTFDETTSEVAFTSKWQRFADTSVVYLDAANGLDTANGATPETAVQSLAKAFELVTASSETNKKIAVIGRLQVTGELPRHTVNVTITGDGSGDSIFDLYNDYIYINGPTTFENIQILTTTSKGGKYLSSEGEPIVIGKGVTTDSKKIPLRLGFSMESGVSEKDTRKNNPVLATIESGVYGTISLGHYYNGTDYGRTPGGKIVVNGGTIDALEFRADNYEHAGGEHKPNIWTEDVFITINGGSVGTVSVNSTPRGGNTFEKALVVIVNNGIATSTPSSLSAGGGAWFMMSEENAGCMLEATETPGTFTVIGGKIAVATALNGREYASFDGTLTVPEGKYNVKYVDSIQYINNGDSITAYSSCTVDLAKETHFEEEGKVFIGWKKNGEAVEQNVSLNAGDVLTAEYLDYNEYDEEANDGDFFIKGAQIRTTGEQGLRFIVEKKNAFYDQIPNVSDFGTIVLPTDLTWGRDMFIDTPIVAEWTWDAETKTKFTMKSSNGYTPTTVVGEVLFNQTDDATQYTLCITGIDEAKYYRYYTVKGYIRFVDLNGVERVLYTDYYQTNLYQIALAALAAGETPTETFQGIKDYVENTRKELYMAENYENRTLLSGYPTTDDTDPHHAMYALKNGLKVREVTIDTGKGERDSIDIVHFADVHLNYINERDIAEGEVNTLSTYRGRSWNRGGANVPNASRAVEYASFFDQTIVTGDIMDYFSWGCAEIIQKIITDRVPNVLYAIGNHEPAELMQQDMSGLSNRYTLEERYARLQTFWPNDLKYTSKILKNDDGDEMVMVVVLDNQRDAYWEEQYEPLKADIETAREKDIPILIFEHDPICTKNPNDTVVHYFYEAGDYKESSHNWTNQFAGCSSSSPETMKVYNLIVQNPDVIKGIFCGHDHNHIYTEVYAQDADGQPLKDEDGNQVVIPQYVVTSNSYGSGSVIKITVK